MVFLSRGKNSHWPTVGSFSISGRQMLHYLVPLSSFNDLLQHRKSASLGSNMVLPLSTKHQCHRNQKWLNRLLTIAMTRRETVYVSDWISQKIGSIILRSCLHRGWFASSLIVIFLSSFVLWRQDKIFGHFVNWHKSIRSLDVQKKMSKVCTGNKNNIFDLTDRYHFNLGRAPLLRLSLSSDFFLIK